MCIYIFNVNVVITLSYLLCLFICLPIREIRNDCYCIGKKERKILFFSSYIFEEEIRMLKEKVRGREEGRKKKIKFDRRRSAKQFVFDEVKLLT